MAVKEVSTDRVIQRSLLRAHRRNEKGDIDHSLIPADIQAWYMTAATKKIVFQSEKVTLKLKNQVMFQIMKVKQTQIDLL